MQYTKKGFQEQSASEILLVRVGRLELPASSSQRDSNLVLHVHENHLALSAPENLLSGALSPLSPRPPETVVVKHVVV